MDKEGSNGTLRRQDQIRMPADSLLFERIVPVLLIIMALVMVVVLLMVLGFLVGLVPYQ